MKDFKFYAYGFVIAVAMLIISVLLTLQIVSPSTDLWAILFSHSN